MLLFFPVPAVRLSLPATPALRLASPVMQLGANADSSILVSGGSRQTWFYDPNVQQVQVVLNTDGRSIDADIEVWQDEFGNNIPWKMHAYIENSQNNEVRPFGQNGKVRPFSAVVETPRGPNTVAVRNTGQPMYSIAVSVQAGPVRCPSSECLSSSTSVERGDSRTYQFDPSVGSIQILLETTGRPLNARIELVEGPNNNKQVVEVYSQDGCDRPFFCILETPGSGSSVSVVNTANDPMTAAVVPHYTNQGMTSNVQRLRRGRQQGGYGPALGQGYQQGSGQGVQNTRDATQRNRNRRQQGGYGPALGQGQQQGSYGPVFSPAEQQGEFQGDRSRRQQSGYGPALGQGYQQGGYAQQGENRQQGEFQGERSRRQQGGYGPALGQDYQQSGYGGQGDYNGDDSRQQWSLQNLFGRSQDVRRQQGKQGGYGQRQDGYGQRGDYNRDYRQQSGFQSTRDYGQYGPQGGGQNTRGATEGNRLRRQQDDYGQRGDFRQQSALQKLFQRSPDATEDDRPRRQQGKQGQRQGGYGQRGDYNGQRRDYRQQSGFQSTRDQIRGQQRQQSGYGPALGQGQQGGYMQVKGENRQQRGFQAERSRRQQGGYGPALGQGQQGGYGRQGGSRKQRGFQGNSPRRQQGPQGGYEGGQGGALWSTWPEDFNSLVRRLAPGGRYGQGRPNLGRRQSSRITGSRRSWGGDD